MELLRALLIPFALLFLAGAVAAGWYGRSLGAEVRLLQREGRKTEIAEGIIAAIKAGLEMRPEDMPKPDLEREQLQVNPALADLLRVLLKAKSESLGVAPRLIASAADLDAIAAGERNVDALKGWRAEAFGDDAMRLCRGEIALSAKGNEVRVVRL